MTDDKPEKDFEPYEIDLPVLEGHPPVKATVMPARRIAEEEYIHVCRKIVDEEEERKYMIPGSITTTADCGHRVWIAPSGQKVQAMKKNLMICTECIMEVVRGLN